MHPFAHTHTHTFTNIVHSDVRSARVINNTRVVNKWSYTWTKGLKTHML